MLVVVTPTGTGLVDPAAIDSVEYLHDGAVASVALQYSYLASWLYLLVEPGYSADVARALFKEIYGYWITLPKESRPRLYLHGISLGAMNSEQSTDLIEVMGDPFDGALWSGPPYSSRLWRWLTDHRNPGSQFVGEADLAESRLIASAVAMTASSICWDTRCTSAMRA